MARTVHTLLPGQAEALPVFVHHAGPGPVVAVTANIHGDEATGVAAVHELDAWLGAQLRRGTVALYPSLNPRGLHTRTRVLPEGHDLNRLFPGRAAGDPSQQHAATIWEDLTGRCVDLLVDLHADSARSVPYVIVDRALAQGPGASLGPTLGRLAAATGLTVLHELTEAAYLRYALDRSLTGALVNRRGVPAITVEAGPRRWIARPAVEAAVGAVRGVLGQVGLVDTPGRPHPSRVEGGPWRRAAAPGARRGGVFREHIAPGERFSRGDVLGAVIDLGGAVLDELRAPADGLVVSWAEITWLEAGGSPGTLGLLEGDECAR